MFDGIKTFTTREEYDIINKLALNFRGCFQDSPGVEGDSVSVPQCLLRIKANLN